MISSVFKLILACCSGVSTFVLFTLYGFFVFFTTCIILAHECLVWDLKLTTCPIPLSVRGYEIFSIVFSEAAFNPWSASSAFYFVFFGLILSLVCPF